MCIVDCICRIARDIGGVFNLVRVAYSQIHYYYCSTSPHVCNFVGGVSFSTLTVERAPCLPCYGPFTTVIDQRCEACNVNLEVRAWEYSDCISVMHPVCAEVCICYLCELNTG